MTATRADRRGISLLVAGVLLAAASACSSPGTPTPGPTPTPTPTPTPSPLLQMSGRVLDENGVAVAAALVEVDYSPGGRPSNPPSSCPSIGSTAFCWLATHTNTMGEYAVEFDPRPWLGRGLGYVYAMRDGYEVDVQWVPLGASPAVRNLRTRSSRKIVPGDSTAVLVDANSSLCTDLEDLWLLTSRCEIVVIETGPGTLNVEARAVSGSVVPSMYWYTTGNYAGFIERPGPGVLSIPVRAGTYRILIGLPEGSAAQQFNVTTSLR